MKKWNMLKNGGFSLTELIVASLVFAMAAAGLIATVSSMTTPSVEVSEDVQAAFLAREQLDALRSSVDADSWDAAGNPLVTSVGNYDLGYKMVGPTNYHIEYQVSDDDDVPGVRRVDMTVSW
ncbi:MAG: prepilin-type N-terminal cleavage/methylation domain-containing protein [Candidatus Omnitrophota bacterium]